MEAIGQRLCVDSRFARAEAPKPDEGHGADLVVVDVTAVPSPPVGGRDVTLKVRVKNAGDRPAGGFDVTLDRDVEGTARLAEGLEPGKQATLTFGPTRVPVTSSLLTIAATVDANDEVEERDENNNWLVAMLPVQSPLPPPQPPTPPTPPIPIPPHPPRTLQAG